MNTASDLRRRLNAVFAYKAEWLKGDIFKLFSEPTYFPALLTHYPCALVGGRGTGKTTVLRGLSYQGRYALEHCEDSQVATWPSYGFYYRIDTNRVTAFQGPEAETQRWQKLFAHYLNLLLVDIVFEFLQWFEERTSQSIDFSKSDVSRIANSLCVDGAQDWHHLRQSLGDALISFESYINNISDEPPIKLSLQGAPLDLLFKTISKVPAFSGKTFSFLIDEYENLAIDQQIVVNTLIKHASDVFVFKIGVRELGWKCKTTLNPHEQLVSPADYRLIDISTELAGDAFADFAGHVCDARLDEIRTSFPDVIDNVARLLPSLSLDEEARLLGVEEHATAIRNELSTVLDDQSREQLNSMKDMDVYLLAYQARSRNEPLLDVFRTFLEDKEAWQRISVNHSYAALFTLRRRKTGIRKYYCGWLSFALLAAGNIRYLLELVDKSLVLHLRDHPGLTTAVSPTVQTEAAQSVGRKNLSELEGLSIHGAQLTKLLLGLGRVFGVMAANAEGHAPEVDQFHFSEDQLPAETEELLRAAIMHLALVRFSGTKPTSEVDVRDYDYAIHPIFAPFFVFSPRRKRKMPLLASELMRLVQNPRAGVEAILSRTKRSTDEPLPDQLLLFEKYYDGAS